MAGDLLPPAGAEVGLTPVSPGLLRRLAILCYDALPLFAVLFAATLIVFPLNGGEAFAPYDALYSAYLLAVTFFYFGWFWTHGGQTLGMRAWGVRLVGRNATRIKWRDCLVRFLAALISLLPFGLGLFWTLIDAEKRAWHDRISGTRLIIQSAPRGEPG